MKPIPLSDHMGRVYTYACGRCHHVPAGSTLLGVRRARGPHKELVKSALARASECCVCRDCGGVVDGISIWCATCLRWMRFCAVWQNVGFCASRGFDEDSYRRWLRSDEDND